MRGLELDTSMVPVLQDYEAPEVMAAVKKVHDAQKALADAKADLHRQALGICHIEDLRLRLKAASYLYWIEREIVSSYAIAAGLLIKDADQLADDPVKLKKVAQKYGHRMRQMLAERVSVACAHKGCTQRVIATSRGTEKERRNFCEEHTYKPPVVVWDYEEEARRYDELIRARKSELAQLMEATGIGKLNTDPDTLMRIFSHTPFSETKKTGGTPRSTTMADIKRRIARFTLDGKRYRITVPDNIDPRIFKALASTGDYTTTLEIYEAALRMSRANRPPLLH